MKKHVRRHAVVSIALAALICGLAGAARTQAGQGSQGNQGNQDEGGRGGPGEIQTATPIKHVIVLIGENWTFDSIFATYRPKDGQRVSNLLSRGIVTASGDPGPNFALSRQFEINQPFPPAYFIDALSTAGKTAYQQAPGAPSFPPPNTAYIPTAPGGLDQGQGPF